MLALLPWLLKPLPALLLAAWVARSGASRAVAIGLCCAAAGDELLLGAGTIPFALGMLAFVAMHGCYIAGFSRLATCNGVVRRRPWLALPYAIAVVGTTIVLAPQAGPLAVPVAIYSVVLGAMALVALDQIGRIALPAALAIAGGALLFMCSDTLLAFSTFSPAWPLSATPTNVLVLGTYYVAQVAIASGVVATMA
jgi:uncharacterized membrane protein YhhN